MTQFNRVLISNRGEIVVRVIRTLRSLGIESVAVYSDADASSPYVTQADNAYRLPGVYSNETYLNAKKIIEIALKAELRRDPPWIRFSLRVGRVFPVMQGQLDKIHRP